MKTLAELRETIQDVRTGLENYNITPEEAYCSLYNSALDYDYHLEDLFSDFVTEEEAEEMAKHELENGWLARLYCFLWDCNFCAESFFKINGYWNLEEVHYKEIELLIDELEDRIEEAE